MGSKIDWLNGLEGYTGEVWNPVVGCTKISEGCKNCYAEEIINRFQGSCEKFKNGFNKVICFPEVLKKPYKWKKPRLIFVNSISDLFHKDVSNIFIRRVLQVIINNPQHIFIVLTKRAERMHDYFTSLIGFSGLNTPINNLWLGVSVENEKTNIRIKYLRDIKFVGKRIISFEPLLGNTGWKVFDNIDWIIVGCESGNKNVRREMPMSEVRFLKESAQICGIPFYFKQKYEGNKLIKKPLLNGKQWVQFPKLKEN